MNKKIYSLLSIVVITISACTPANSTGPSTPSDVSASLSPSANPSLNPSTPNSTPNPNRTRFNSKAELIAFLECVKSKATYPYQQSEMDNEIKRVNLSTEDLSGYYYETKTWLSTLSTSSLRDVGVSCL